MKTCPYCAEQIQEQAILCRYCKMAISEKVRLRKPAKVDGSSNLKSNSKTPNKYERISEADVPVRFAIKVFAVTLIISVLLILLWLIKVSVLPSKPQPFKIDGNPSVESNQFGANGYTVISRKASKSFHFGDETRNVRVLQVLVPPNLSRPEYANLFKKVIDDVVVYRDLAVHIFFFRYEREVYEGYDLARVSWCPNGECLNYTDEIIQQRDRSNYSMSIEWAGQAERTFTGLENEIQKSMAWDIKNIPLKELRRDYKYNKGEGALTIVWPLVEPKCISLDSCTSVWQEAFTERDVLIAFRIALQFYALEFKEIKKYDYTIVWKGKTLFQIVTNRAELDALESNMPKYQAWLNAQPDNVDINESNSQDVEYYHKLLSNFKNYKLDM